ncbi:Vancomycin resistance protein YoaR, contains peptidoglycan-binding and VanW domains [Nannocystis exedens]|uniref:Vancomycin resistance protein YoaR, contains peptidoglycan-binding and VanW domains n=1 Tax=Nannocystis exedens TaxID=54 RepID=A0A1I1T3D5_9BACT|nr:VanW family protein [Nannocystis exedens]PCC66809.1 vanW domain protein [Nannocystis exedens]SFD53142.1 Vancomycin resistance protein YoaR, contains peptidoglycan-binding and VanW domains [Nannocystis exedens]
MSQPAPRAAAAARTLAPRRAQPRTLVPTAAPALELAETPDVAPETAPAARRRRLGVLPILESAAMAIGLAAVAAALWQDLAAVGDQDRVVPGVRLGGHEVGGLTASELPAIAEAAVLTALDRKLVLAAPGVEVETTARALGAVPAPETAIAAALRVGHSGDLLADLRARDRALRGEVDLAPGFRFNEDVALDQLLALAPKVERPSLATRFDMDNRRVLPAQRGTRLSAFDSLSAVAVGLASGADRIDLVTQPGPEVPDPWASIADGLDIGAVLASFETPYSTEAAYADRAYNLKIGAAPLDGYVLMPGATMSFNQVVGDRTGEAGYRFAAGIADGELIDTVGGGICQISSTLYGAAFFAGLDLVHSRPHSRPSAYVDMGLDSTVVYGHVDMKLKNPFDFPVVFHTRVAAGKVRVEVLGARKVFDEVAFERRVQEVLPFNTIVRNDSSLATGAETVSQRGMRGFKVVRTRKLYKDGQVAKTESWDLFYPPTTEILRRGTNPRGERPEPKKLPPLRDPARELRLVQ